jgi:hypothetical protein
MAVLTPLTIERVRQSKFGYIGCLNRFVAGLKAGLIGSVMATHITAQTYLIVLILTSVLKRLIIVRYLDTDGVEVMTGI